MSVVEDELVPTPMLLTDDPEAILRFALEAFYENRRCALITLVHIEGGASRGVGTQMAVRDDGYYCGYVSGGCVESAVAAEAMMAMAQNRDRELVLGRNSPLFDIVLPCGGSIRLIIHVIRNIDALEQVVLALGERLRAGLVYMPGEQRMRLAAESELGACAWHNGNFVRSYRPRTRLVLHGRSIELAATAAVATAAGLDVVPISDDVWIGDNAGMIDSDTAVAFLHHDLDREMRGLELALGSDAFYIGALGSRRTHERRCAELQCRGVGLASISRIKAPLGLIPATRDANTLALSVVADIAAADAQRSWQGRHNTILQE